MAKLIDFKIQAPAEMLDSMIANLRGERNAIHNQLGEVYESIHSLRMERMRGSKIDEERMRELYELEEYLEDNLRGINFMIRRLLSEKFELDF